MTLLTACEGLHSSEPETQSLADLLDVKEVCRFFGGTRPLNPATLYRGIRKGCYPAPVKVGPGSSRWLRNECEAALARMAEGRAVR
jgi:predicted DNA-binding transcriptional regulator AlpA